MGKFKVESGPDTKPKSTGNRLSTNNQGVRKARKKKRRRKKNPDAPRRPATAFIRFSQANRPRIIEQNPQASFADIGRLLGQAWRDATDQERMQYHDEEDQARADFRRRLGPPDAGRQRQGPDDSLLKRCTEAELKEARHRPLTEAKPKLGFLLGNPSIVAASTLEDLPLQIMNALQVTRYGRLNQMEMSKTVMSGSSWVRPRRWLPLNISTLPISN